MKTPVSRKHYGRSSYFRLFYINLQYASRTEIELDLGARPRATIGRRAYGVGDGSGDGQELMLDVMAVIQGGPAPHVHGLGPRRVIT